MDKLTQVIQQHSCQCQRLLQRTRLQMLGHTAMVTLQCDNGHKLLWPTSAYLGTNYLANSRMAHSYFISGILPNQYLRVGEAAGIGKLSDVYLSEFFKNYKECVKMLADELCVDALYEKIVAYPETDSINILTYARHGTALGGIRNTPMSFALVQKATKCYVLKPSQEPTSTVLRSMNCSAPKQYKTIQKIKKVAVFLCMCIVMTETRVYKAGCEGRRTLRSQMTRGMPLRMWQKKLNVCVQNQGT